MGDRLGQGSDWPGSCFSWEEAGFIKAEEAPSV